MCVRPVPLPLTIALGQVWRRRATSGADEVKIVLA